VQPEPEHRWKNVEAKLEDLLMNTIHSARASHVRPKLRPEARGKEKLAVKRSSLCCQSWF
jgi:hypothetical protein